MRPFYKISRERSGEIFIFTESILWAAFPVISVLASAHIPSLFAAAGSTFAAAIFFAGVISVRRKWFELKIRSAWSAIFATTILISVIYYALFFVGLQYTSVGSAAIILQMEVWFSFVFFGLILRKEKYTSTAIVGAILMFIGVLFILFPGKIEINYGDFLILLATAFPPAGNYFQQLARKKVSAATLLFVRSAIGAIFLFALAIFFEINLPRDFSAALPFLAVNGFLLFGFSKILFIEGIHRLPVAKAVSLGTLVPFFTLFYAFIFLRESPTIFQICGLPFLIFGALLISRNNFLREPLE